MAVAATQHAASQYLYTYSKLDNYILVELRSSVTRRANTQRHSYCTIFLLSISRGGRNRVAAEIMKKISTRNIYKLLHQLFDIIVFESTGLFLASMALDFLCRSYVRTKPYSMHCRRVFCRIKFSFFFFHFFLFD